MRKILVREEKVKLEINFSEGFCVFSRARGSNYDDSVEGPLHAARCFSLSFSIFIKSCQLPLRIFARRKLVGVGLRTFEEERPPCQQRERRNFSFFRESFVALVRVIVFCAKKEREREKMKERT